jgi:putative FmdB family regulatory protein
MPIYEYQCQSCGDKFEIMHRMSEGPSKSCDECGSADLKKLISAVGFQLKGTGWYETDFKNSGSDKSKDSGSKDSGSKDSGSKDSGSKDSGSKDSGKESSSQEGKKSGGSKDGASTKSESVKSGNVAKSSE